MCIGAGLFAPFRFLEIAFMSGEAWKAGTWQVLMESIGI